MKMSNETYDRLKWVALVFVPAFEFLILTLGEIWDIPYYARIGATVAALGLFLAKLLGVSAKKYYEAIGKTQAVEEEAAADEEEKDETDYIAEPGFPEYYEAENIETEDPEVISAEDLKEEEAE